MSSFEVQSVTHVPSARVIPSTTTFIIFRSLNTIEMFKYVYLIVCVLCLFYMLAAVYVLFTDLIFDPLYGYLFNRGQGISIANSLRLQTVHIKLYYYQSVDVGLCTAPDGRNHFNHEPCPSIRSSDSEQTSRLRSYCWSPTQGTKEQF